MRAVSSASSTPRTCKRRRFGRPSTSPGTGWLATKNVSRLAIGRPFSRSTSGRFSISDRSPTVRLLMISSVAPSESTNTLPGRPVPLVSRCMPLTKAIITVNKAMTAVNASAVKIVVFQRTVRLRTLYRKGTLPTAKSPARITPAIINRVRTITPPWKTPRPPGHFAPTRPAESCPTARPVRPVPVPTTVRRRES